MRKLAEMIVRALESEKIIPAADREVYLYGFDAALYTFFSTAGLILLGCLLERGIETLIIVAVFYVNQTLGGGFHASTHWNCFIIMAGGLLCCLASFLLPFSPIVYCFLGLISIVLMMKYPLVLHKNKEYLMSQRDRFCKRSRIALLTQTLLFLGVVLWRTGVVIQSVAIALAACSVSRLVAVLQHKDQFSC